MFEVILILGVCVAILLMLIDREVTERRHDEEIADLRGIVDDVRAELGEWMGVPRLLTDVDLPEDTQGKEEVSRL